MEKVNKLEKNDARKVDSKTLQYLRDRAIVLRESGVSITPPINRANLIS